MLMSRSPWRSPGLLHCLVLALILLCSHKIQSQSTIDPTYLSVSEGLSSPNVHRILQDSYGLIWLGTSNGLQKYDGYVFQSYKHDPGKATSLLDNLVFDIVEDAEHNLWIAHSSGVSKFDRRTGQFRNYAFGPIFNFLPGQTAPAMRLFIDSGGRLWAGTRNLGLALYDATSDNWKTPEYDIEGLDPRVSHSGFILGIAEDSKGGIWASSSEFGLLHRPTGATAFKQIPAFRGTEFIGSAKDPITEIFADKDNVIWMTSRHGVHKYFPETDVIKTVWATADALLDDRNFFNDIVRDPEGNIWVTNNFRGILKFHQNSDAFDEISVSGRRRIGGTGWNITLDALMIDRSGIFWFSSLENGAVKYDPVNKPFTAIVHSDANPGSLSASGVFGLLVSSVKPGFIYVGTRGDGLNVYDPAKRAFGKVHYKAEADVFGGSVRGLAENIDGSLWVGTWGDGMIKTDRTYREIKRYKYVSKDMTSIPGNQIRIIKPGKNGRLWVGTNTGLCIFDPETGRFDRIRATDTKMYSPELVEEVTRLLKSENNLGMIDQVKDFENKTLQFEIKDPGTYVIVSVAEADATGPADFGWIENARKDTIWSFPEYKVSMHAGGASKNRITIAPFKMEAGSYMLRYSTDDSHAFDKWNLPPPDQLDLYGIAVLRVNSTELKLIENEIVKDDGHIKINGSNISDIELTDKYVWVASIGNGLSRIDPDADTVEYFMHSSDDLSSLSSNDITDIFEDSRGTIWVATALGLNKFNAETNTFQIYSEADGLPTNLVTGVLEGDNGEMWIATQNGLSQMVPNDKLGKVTFINYNSTDGLGGDVFLQQTNAKGPDGQFYFGGDHGITTFRSVTANKTPPAVVISNLYVSNRSVQDTGGPSFLNESLLDAKEIALPFDKNNLSFEFAALHYANPRKNQYAHMLKGYDKDWLYDNRTFASYTNLDPGEYDFMIRASNAYGIWNEEGRSIHISILAPWWKTRWAYAVYVVLFGSITYLANRAIRSSIKQKERERSREKELRQAKEIEKAYAHLKETQAQLVQSEKMASLGELTAGIAHEIQNPLNFVNNFSEINKELIDEMNEALAAGNLDEAKAIARSVSDNEVKINFHGKRADGIVKGMLQHSRSSSGVKEPTDINMIADEYLRLAYHGLRAKDKTFSAAMKTTFDPAVGKVNAVPQDIGRVVLNLITNAFYVVAEKKAQLNGKASEGDVYEPTVTVATSRAGNKVEIRVTDNGNGIPQGVIDKIFQPFFTTKPSGQGTGLGLSMSYEIITKGHGGELKVETQVGLGTTFIVVLPN
jgi:signal transduction histidine kinase/ligand-binding sensor domain-containing protein